MNNVIRQQAKKRGVFLWEIAYRLQLTDGNFSRKLRRELSDAEQRQILEIIEEIAQGRDSNG